MRRPALAFPLLAALLAPACSSPGASTSSAGPPPAFEPIACADVLYVWSGGSEAWLVDERDAGLRAALEGLGPKLRELAEQDPEVEPGAALAADLVIESLLDPWCLRVGARDEDDGQMPVWAQLALRAQDGPAAAARAAKLTQALSEADVPSLGVDEAYHGLSVVPLGPVELHHGVARDGRADTVLIASGGLELGEVAHGTLDLPSGVKPAFALRLDLEGLADLMAGFGEEDPQALLEMGGALGSAVQLAFGQGADRAHAALRMQGWVPAARAAGELPQGRIPERALQLVPRDATLASLQCMDLGAIADALRRAGEFSASTQMLAQIEGLEGVEIAAGPEDEDPLAACNQALGLDLEADVLAHLGETVGVYLADSTGGGGLWSAVAFVEVRDRDKLSASIAKLEARLLECLAEDEDAPEVALRHGEHAGARVTTLAMPGLPVPVEPSWAVREGWWFVALTPQGLRAALDQAARAEDSLLDHAGFQAEVTADLDALVSLSWLDSPRFLRDGYPLLAMLGAALSNGLANAADLAGLAAEVAPSYPALARGARGGLALGRVEGEDLLVTWQGDRSLAVHGTALAGCMGPMAPFLLAAFGVSAIGTNTAQTIGSAAAILPGAEGSLEMELGISEDELIEIDAEEIVPARPVEPEEPR